MKIDKHFSLFYGIMLGDGCLSQTGRHKFIAVTLSLKDDPPFLNKVILPLLFKFTGRKISTRIRKNDGAIGVNFSDKNLFEFLSQTGFPVGKKGSVKIPAIFYRKKLLKQICQGLFATDGSLVLTNNNGTLYPRVEICSISNPLMTQVSDYLNSKEIKCNFYLAKRRKPGKWARKPQYRLQINGKRNLDKFITKIGFVNPKQIEKLKRYMAMKGFEPSVPAL